MEMLTGVMMLEIAIATKSVLVAISSGTFLMVDWRNGGILCFIVGWSEDGWINDDMMMF